MKSFKGAGEYQEALLAFAFRRPSSTRAIPAEAFRRIQIARLDASMRTSFVSMLAGCLVILALVGEFWDRRSSLPMDFGIAGTLTAYGILLQFCRSWVRRRREQPDAPIRLIPLLLLRLMLASFWGYTLAAFAAVGTPLEQGLLLAVLSGILSTFMFGGPATYALAGWIPTAVGGLASLFATGHLISPAFLVSVIIYYILTFLGMMLLDAQAIERGLNVIRLEEHAETIGILLRDFEESSSDWLWETDATLTMRHISPRFAEVSLRKPQDMEIGFFELLTGSAGNMPIIQDRAIAALRRCIETHAPFRELVVPVQIGTEQRWWALTGKPLFDHNGKFAGYRGVGSDVTAAHRSRERIAYLARHDALTDLANRSGFNEAMISVLADCHRQKAALLCLDLDEFKAINDGYGHGVGDSVLRAVAQRIRGTLREHDFAARLGGDEFAILLAIESREQAMTVAARLIESLSPPFSCGDLVIKVGVSIGIAIAPENGEEPDVLYRNADLALYRAKMAGRGTWRLFDPEMDRHLHERRILQRDMRTALDANELFVEYQPIVDLSTSEVVALEALVRWQHRERGIIPPAEFVPIAETSGLIGSIGTFVLMKAAALARHLPPRIRIAVNLSPVQLRDESLLERISDVLGRLGVSPDRIEFEVTESVMLEIHGRTLENLRGLRCHGHRVAIDDFGTGYSSLAVLRDFPFDRLKIDRSFISDLESEEIEGPIVKAIISLARALGISVTAEGVETERHAAILRAYRCASAQGFYFSEPLTETQVLALLLPSGSKLPRADMALPYCPAPPPEAVGHELVKQQRIGSPGRPHLVRSQ
jgi:diguanylate cyclase (GGDEF)-like protein